MRSVVKVVIYKWTVRELLDVFDFQAYAGNFASVPGDRIRGMLMDRGLVEFLSSHGEL